VGGTGPRAGCSPLLHPVQCSSRAMQRRLDAPAVRSNCNQRRALLTERSGRRSSPPAPIRPRLRDGQSQNRGVSDHEIWPDLRSHPRPQKRSLTPRCLVSAGVDDLLYATGAVRTGARNLHRLFIGRRTRLCGSRSRVQGAPRCFARACARLAALTARSANLWRATIDGLGVNLLTNARPRRYCEILFDGCGPQPLHIARCEGHESAASGHDSFLSRFSPWPPTRATTRPRSRRSERTALRRRPKRQIRPDFRFDIVTLSRPLACQSSMHRSRTQCCPFTAERARETGIDVQHGQAYHGRTTTASGRAAATASAARSHEREQPDRRAV
jgi:hypothetical protein